MLGLNKQPDGVSCVAYALLNLGVVTQEAAKAYSDSGKEWDHIPLMLQRFQIAMGYPMEKIPGSWPYVQHWLQKWAPEVLPILGTQVTEAGKFPAPTREFPMKGRGLLLVQFPMSAGHALAVEDGMISDSGDSTITRLETWEEVQESYANIGLGEAQPVAFIPITEEQSHALAHA